MRLTRPTLVSPVVVTCDSTDLPGNTLNNELKNDCTALQGMEALAIGQFMVLPQSFGYVSTHIFPCISNYGKIQMFFTTLNKNDVYNFRNIYLGEIFSSYLCVHNGSNQVVKNVTVKVSFDYTCVAVISIIFLFYSFAYFLISPDSNITYKFHRRIYKRAHR